MCVGGWDVQNIGFPQVQKAYRSLVAFVSASWELYKSELEAILFPIFVHCYLLMVNTNHSTQVRRITGRRLRWPPRANAVHLAS